MKTLGLDIGGANLKAAHSDGEVWSIPFELWRTPLSLNDQLGMLITQLPAWDRLAVTMTAELCDCFISRGQGVERVLAAGKSVANGRPVYVWQNTGRFVDIPHALADPLSIASANWHALACYVAQKFPDGLSLLIDTGSTTTDIIRLIDGKPQPRSLTDHDRLTTGELVYIGAQRTPLMALGPTVDWRGRPYRLMSEQFATTGDIHLLSGDLEEAADRNDTSDGRARTRDFAASRLLRMIGADSHMVSLEGAVELADRFAKILHQRIGDAIIEVLGSVMPKRVVISGSGGYVAFAAARRVIPTISPIALADSVGPTMSEVACAFALVQLMDAVPQPS